MTDPIVERAPVVIVTDPTVEQAPVVMVTGAVETASVVSAVGGKSTGPRLIVKDTGKGVPSGARDGVELLWTMNSLEH